MTIEPRHKTWLRWYTISFVSCSAIAAILPYFIVMAPARPSMQQGQAMQANRQVATKSGRIHRGHKVALAATAHQG